jgi:hypothetical protein
MALSTGNIQMPSILSVESKHQKGMNMHMMHQKTLWQCTQYDITVVQMRGTSASLCENNQGSAEMTEFWMGYIVVKQQSDMHKKNSF